MRLKTYTAASTADAMDQVRKELGERAVIVSEQTIPETGEAWVTAAIEPGDEKQDSARSPAKEIETVGLALERHGVPLGFTDRLTRIMQESEGGQPEALLAGALSSQIAFAPIGGNFSQAILLTGPPGAGKTIVAGKLAARERLAGRPAMLATSDTVRAGGAAQLGVFAGILGSKLTLADGKEALAELMKGAPKTRPSVIDTQGANPFDRAALDEVAGLAEAAGAEPVLVLAAGGDARESADIAEAFAGIGATRMIATRIDCARRLGGVLAAADGSLALAELSLTPTIADGLEPADPGLLANILLNAKPAPNAGTSR